MFVRYPGYGKSIPSVLIVSTSAPFAPSVPPPAFGAFFATASCLVAIFGVACTTGFVTCLGLSGVFTFTTSFAAALGGALAGATGAGAVEVVKVKTPDK